MKYEDEDDRVPYEQVRRDIFMDKYDKLSDEFISLLRKNYALTLTLILVTMTVAVICAFLIIAYYSGNLHWKLFEDGSYVITGCLPFQPCID